MDVANTAKYPQGRYFITGAGGFVGRHLIQRIVAGGGDVIAADLHAPEGLPEGVEARSCDIRDKASVEAALGDEPIDYAVHLAAIVGDWGSDELFESTNVLGTQNVFTALLERGVTQAVHFSSIVVMGYTPGYDADESIGPIEEVDPYTATKARGEAWVKVRQSEGAPIVIIRPGDVYGPHCEPWVKRPLRMMESGQMVFVDGGQGSFAHVYIDSLVEGVRLALTNPKARGETYILTDGIDDTTFKHYFTRLAEVCGVKPPKVSVPRPIAVALATVMEAAARLFGFTPPITRAALSLVQKRCSYSIDKAKSELGYDPKIPLEEGLARVAAIHGR